MRARYPGTWATEVKICLNDTRLGTSSTDKSMQDPAALLVIMDRKWGEVFRETLGKAERSLVNEIITVSVTDGLIRRRSPAMMRIERSTP